MATALFASHSIASCTEHELVAAVRGGNDRAFEELFSRYRSRITAYIAGMVRDHGRAEDITQEVFISALRRLRHTERPIAFKPWIYEIAKNACIDEYRRTRRTQEVPFDGDEDHGASERDLWSNGLTPDAAIENKERLADLRGAFGGLSESHHQILVLRELEGLSYSEIGERMGMSRAIVESTLFRARRRLSEEYEELVSGRRCQRIHALIEAGDERAIKALGIRERRRIARHLSHCQPCRRFARMEGLDDSLFKAPSKLGKIAALLPLPWLRWRRAAGGEEEAVAGSGSHSFAVAQSLQSVTRFVDQLGPSVGIGRAAAAVAALAVAGAGGGLVTGFGAHASSAATGLPPAAAAGHAPSSGGVLAIAASPFAQSSGANRSGGLPPSGPGSSGPAGPLAPKPGGSGSVGDRGVHPGGPAAGSPGSTSGGPLPPAAASSSPSSSPSKPPGAPTPPGGAPAGGSSSSVVPPTPSVPNPSDGGGDPTHPTHPTHPPHPVVPGGSQGVPSNTPSVVPPSPVPGLGNGGQPPGHLGGGGNGGGQGSGGHGNGGHGAGGGTGGPGNGGRTHSNGATYAL